MATTHKTRLINPRLGIYFSIFASAFIALFLLLLILEQLGLSDGTMRSAVLLTPLVLYLAIGLAAFSRSSSDFFVAGRRVPAAYNGMLIAIAATGGVGLTVLTGLFLINGFDAWCLALGVTTGFVIMGTTIAPYLRKYGAYTVPTYLGRRFESRTLRIVSATVFAVPMLLILTAELDIAISAVNLLTGQSFNESAALLSIALCAALVFGGMRALGWVGTVQAIAAIVAVIVPTAMLGVIETNLPLAQFSYGPVLRNIGRMEVSQDIPIQALSPLAFNLATDGLTLISQRLATPYGSLGPLSFALVTATAAMGIAGAPWLLPTCNTTLGVFEARKSLAWTIFFYGIIMLSLSALAIFMRNLLMLDVVGVPPTAVPDWYQALNTMGVSSIGTSEAQVKLTDISFARDNTLYAIPIAAEFPKVVLYLTIAGVMSAALAASAATVYALATMISEDIIQGIQPAALHETTRLTISRVLIAVMVLVGFLFARLIDTDVLQLLLWALSLSAATAFPILMMSLWWRRITAQAALAGIVAGFATSIAAVLSGDLWLVPLPRELIGLTGLVPTIGIATLVTMFGPSAPRHLRDALRDIRIPGGETIFDREQRLQRLRDQKTVP
ncbi:MAG: solute symporter family protein [Hyphomicrobiaceae bacterium]